MVLLKIAVKDNRLIKVRDRLIIEDTINGVDCHFEFRSDWSALKTTVVLARGHIYPATRNPQTIAVFLDDNNECTVPPEIISERGEFSIGLIGENDETRIVTNWLYFKANLGCYDAIVPPNPPTPSEYDKILGALKNKSDIDHAHDEYITDEEMTSALEVVKKYADDNDADTQYGIEYDSSTNKIKLVNDVSKNEIDIADFAHKGLDGMSATHSWNGTVLTITSASGTSSADLKGEAGRDGKDGETGLPGPQGQPGRDGYTPIKGVDYFDGQNGKDGYTPVKGVDYFDGTDGKDGYTPIKGVDYFDGNDGYTPVKGVDYYTDIEKQTLSAAILEMLKNNIKPARIGEVTLLADAWVGEGNLYSQIVTIDGVTENSQVDLTPDVQQLAIFYDKDIAFVTENDGGVVTVFCIGQKPMNDYEIQVTITEVNV